MQIRAALPSDALAVARVHIRSWQAGYRGLIPDEYLDTLRPEDRAARYTFDNPDPDAPQTYVADDGADICGFITLGPSRDDDALGRGEIFAIYVDPQRWGERIGGALLRDARSRLSTRFSEAVLWMLAGNERARQFYRNDGWLPDARQRTRDVWGIRIDEVRFARALS